MDNKCPYCGSSAQFRKTNTISFTSIIVERYECGCGCVVVRQLKEKILVYEPKEKVNKM